MTPTEPGVLLQISFIAEGEFALRGNQHRPARMEGVEFVVETQGASQDRLVARARRFIQGREGDVIPERASAFVVICDTSGYDSHEEAFVGLAYQLFVALLARR